MVTLQQNSLLEKQEVPFLSNPIPYPEYLYLSISVFFVNLTVPNKQNNQNLIYKSIYEQRMFTIVPWVYVI